jgi:hypothetical protein
MKLSLYIALLAFPLSACSTLPQMSVARPDGSARIPVNNPQLIAEFTRQHAVPQAIAPARPQNGYDAVELSLVQILEQYIPSTYQVFPGPGIQLERKVSYDRSRAWTESLLAALANTGLEATIDHARHAVFINARPAGLASHE